MRRGEKRKQKKKADKKGASCFSIGRLSVTCLLAAGLLWLAEQREGEVGAGFEVYFVGYDGMMASISIRDMGDKDGESAEGNYLLFSERGWEALNPEYPPSANVKEIKELVVVTSDPASLNEDIGLRIYQSDGEVITLSSGSLRVSDASRIIKREGTAEKGPLAVTAYTTHYGSYLSDLVDISGAQVIRMTDGTGKVHEVDGNGILEAVENRIDFLSRDGSRIIKDVKTIDIIN